MNSYFEDIEYHIINQIQKAENRLLIATAWFTNTKIGNEILEKSKTKIDIEIIVDDNEINRNCKNIKSLIDNKIDLIFIQDLSKNLYLMHNKFCVIDNQTIISGSYNWTINANSNDENINVLQDKLTAELYTREFRRIKEIKYLNQNIHLTIDETKEIVDLIYSHFKELLKQNINKLEENLFVNWSNENVKNKIRKIEERIRNTLKKKIGNYGLYLELIWKYGYEYDILATEIEKIEAREKYKKKGLNETEYYLNIEFQNFKIKAIEKLQLNYSTILKRESEKNVNTEPILKIFMFLSNEKLKMAKQIK
jgi:hypothetical protein